MVTMEAPNKYFRLNGVLFKNVTNETCSTAIMNRAEMIAYSQGRIISTGYYPESEPEEKEGE